MMEDEDIFDLQTDIEQNGLLHPIITYDGMILDGRHRLMACRAAGVEPRFEEVSCDPLSLVLSANLHRRQLTSSQRAIVAAKIANLQAGGDQKKHSAILQNGGISQSEAAEKMHISTRLVSTAKSVLENASKNDVKSIESGKKTVSEVAKKLKKEPKVLTDKNGRNLPEELIPDWNRADEIGRDMLAKASHLKTEVEKRIKEKDPAWAEVLNSTIAHAENLYGALKQIVPHALCPSCSGINHKKCRTCAGRGFLSKFRWDTAIPQELKDMK